MRIIPRPSAEPPAVPPAVPPAAPPAAAGPPGDARARAETLWALVLRRFYDHVHRGGQEDDDDDRTR